MAINRKSPRKPHKLTIAGRSDDSKRLLPELDLDCKDAESLDAADIELVSKALAANLSKADQRRVFLLLDFLKAKNRRAMVDFLCEAGDIQRPFREPYPGEREEHDSDVSDIQLWKELHPRFDR
jgi:hypothetical protein